MSRKILFSDNSLRELKNFRECIYKDYLRNGWNVILVAPKNYPIKEQSRLKVYDIKLNRSSKNPIKDALYFLKLLSIYWHEKPNYIFHYTIKPNIFGTLAARLLGIKSSCVVTGLGYVFNSNSFGSGIARSLYKFSLKFSECIFVLNSYNYEYLLKNKYAKPYQLKLLPGGEGVDLNQFSYQ